jgi:hypothetical protein
MTTRLTMTDEQGSYRFTAKDGEQITIRRVRSGKSTCWIAKGNRGFYCDSVKLSGIRTALIGR